MPSTFACMARARATSPRTCGKFRAPASASTPTPRRNTCTSTVASTAFTGSTPRRRAGTGVKNRSAPPTSPSAIAATRPSKTCQKVRARPALQRQTHRKARTAQPFVAIGHQAAVDFLDDAPRNRQAEPGPDPHFAGEERVEDAIGVLLADPRTVVG